jgi:hypothetical protein
MNQVFDEVKFSDRAPESLSLSLAQTAERADAGKETSPADESFVEPQRLEAWQNS